MVLFIWETQVDQSALLPQRGTTLAREMGISGLRRGGRATLAARKTKDGALSARYRADVSPVGIPPTDGWGDTVLPTKSRKKATNVK